MKYLFILFSSMFLFTSCDKPSRIDHEDNKYIYAWNYEGNDSILVKYNKPIYKEFNVLGGHHYKAHHIRVDFNNNGYYDCHSITSDSYVSPNDRCYIVNRAQNTHYPIKAEFKEVFYPTHEYHFIKYK
jgi:hypothetical protein